ncbi:MAG: single-stranded DNA-binding protein [Candidatus Aminicenantes bacterium]|nr:single-stranded DNA-binding protein [Candidatus Aminicenantes bacterium]
MADFQSLNIVILVGRVSSDIQFDTGKGKDKDVSLAKFSLATNERYEKSKQSVQYHPCVMWGHKRAEFCKKNLKKGQLICIQGKLKYRAWKDEQGNPRKTTQVNIDEITFLGKKENYADGPKEEEPEDKPKGSDPF